MFQDVVPGGDELVVHVSHAQPASCFVAGIVFAMPRIATGGGGHGERSDAERGRFAAGPLAPGKYSVHVVVAGRPSFDSALFELAPDEHRDLGTLRLPRVGTLHALLARSDDGPLDGVAVEVTASADGVALAEGSLPAFAERRPEWRVCLAPGAYRLEVVAGRDVLGVASFEIPSEPRAGDLELTVR